MSERETIQRLEAELFTPALQQAARQARETGCSREDTLFAAANAYLRMLVPLCGGRAHAADFLQAQLDHLRAQHEKEGDA